MGMSSGCDQRRVGRQRNTSRQHHRIAGWWCHSGNRHTGWRGCWVGECRFIMICESLGIRIIRYQKVYSWNASIMITAMACGQTLTIWPTPQLQWHRFFFVVLDEGWTSSSSIEALTLNVPTNGSFSGDKPERVYSAKDNFSNKTHIRSMLLMYTRYDSMSAETDWMTPASCWQLFSLAESTVTLLPSFIPPNFSATHTNRGSRLSVLGLVALPADWPTLLTPQYIVVSVVREWRYQSLWHAEG